jgi:hypothetical protein
MWRVFACRARDVIRACCTAEDKRAPGGWSPRRSLLSEPGVVALLHRQRPRPSSETAAMRPRRPRPAPATRSAFAGFRFPPDVIVVAVRWYLRFGLSPNPGDAEPDSGSAACKTRGQFNRASRHRRHTSGTPYPLAMPVPHPTGRRDDRPLSLGARCSRLLGRIPASRSPLRRGLLGPGPRTFEPDARWHPCRPACPARQPLSPVRSFST